MNTCQQAAYEAGYREALDCGWMASFTDFAVYIGDAEDYKFYVDGYEDGLSVLRRKERERVDHFQVFYADASSTKMSFPSHYTLHDVQLETGAEDVFFIFEGVEL